MCNCGLSPGDKMTRLIEKNTPYTFAPFICYIGIHIVFCWLNDNAHFGYILTVKKSLFKQIS